MPLLVCALNIHCHDTLLNAFLTSNIVATHSLGVSWWVRSRFFYIFYYHLDSINCLSAFSEAVLIFWYTCAHDLLFSLTNLTNPSQQFNLTVLLHNLPRQSYLEMLFTIYNFKMYSSRFQKQKQDANVMSRKKLHRLFTHQILISNAKAFSNLFILYSLILIYLYVNTCSDHCNFRSVDYILSIHFLVSCST